MSHASVLVIPAIPEIVLRHREDGDDMAFGKALETVERLDSIPGGWELRRDSVWHNDEHRIFRSSDEVSIQPREGSAIVVVSMPKGGWRGPAEGTRHILDTMRMVQKRGDDDADYLLADQWSMAAFATPADDGARARRVVMASPWEPAAWECEGRTSGRRDVDRILAACPTALTWEGHYDDGLPHVRVDRVEWTSWNQGDSAPDAMETLRAVRAIEDRIAAMTVAKEDRP